MKITAPIEGFTGTTYLGPVVLDFRDGTAEHDGDLSDGARAYLRAGGYGIDGPATSVTGETPEPPDPRHVSLEQVGTQLRDAAVDPRPEDFLPPTNAGEANPHGSQVVAPGIHALDSLPVTPGPVPADPAVQSERETALAMAVLVEQHDVGDATAAAGGDAGGDEQPKGNASRDAWAEYAVAHGADQALVDDMTRDEIRDLFAKPTS